MAPSKVQGDALSHMTKTIGFFGGSFDPIHFGHINLALQLLELHRLDEVLVCPAFCSPFKSAKPPVASPEHRLAMLRLGLEGVPKFRITSLEIEREGPSFTIDTIHLLLEKERAQFRLLVSEETAAHFDRWKESAELLRLAPPLIGTRKTAEPGHPSTPIMDISSTDIRNRIAKGLYCGHLVPAKTLDYICKHLLYTQ